MSGSALAQKQTARVSILAIVGISKDPDDYAYVPPVARQERVRRIARATMFMVAGFAGVFALIDLFR